MSGHPRHCICSAGEMKAPIQVDGCTQIRRSHEAGRTHDTLRLQHNVFTVSQCVCGGPDTTQDSLAERQGSCGTYLFCVAALKLAGPGTTPERLPTCIRSMYTLPRTRTCWLPGGKEISLWSKRFAECFSSLITPI